jgi:hypothetical protein
MRTNPSKFRTVLAIAMLTLALIGVIYAMRYTRGDRFQSVLAVFFNSPAKMEKAWNWCPVSAESVEVLRPGLRQPLVSLDEICQLTIEPVLTDRAQRKLSPTLKVANLVSGQSKILESDVNLEVFRIDGLVFQSQSLSAKLR